MWVILRRLRQSKYTPAQLACQDGGKKKSDQRHITVRSFFLFTNQLTVWAVELADGLDDIIHDLGQ